MFRAAETGDWKVAPTRRLESLRYIITGTALILILFVGLCGCAIRNVTIPGVWVVTEVRLAGVSALSEAEAKQWIGRSLSIGNTSSSLTGEHITGCRIIKKEYAAQTFFEDGFRIHPSTLGFTDSKVCVYEIQQANGQAWMAPGATILLGKKLVLTSWDGVFFVLHRKALDTP